MRRANVLELLRLGLRGLALVALTYVGILPVVLFNALERAVPLGVAQGIVRFWGRSCLWLCGVRLRRVGTPMAHPGALVANHVGWIDIFTLLTADRVKFVSKADVAGWPLVGWLSRQIGTLYIERRRSGARAQAQAVAARLVAGDRLCFFPEGTSTDGKRVLAFRSSLFAAFEDPALSGHWVQPVSVVYRPAAGLPETFFGWWGSMPLGPHVQAVLALSAGSSVDVVFHPPIAVATAGGRKRLAAAAEAAVRAGVETGQPVQGDEARG